jgi:hypothetical protein
MDSSYLSELEYNCSANFSVAYDDDRRGSCVSVFSPDSTKTKNSIRSQEESQGLRAFSIFARAKKRVSERADNTSSQGKHDGPKRVSLFTRATKGKKYGAGIVADPSDGSH